jgi:DNA polymerase III epsilon subunit-like protein
MTHEDIRKTRSNWLADSFQFAHPPLHAHDALDDALSVAHVIQDMLRKERLRPSDMHEPLALP